MLTLRYLDDCSVDKCAELIGRTVHTTEALLARARRAFRAQYSNPEGRSVMTREINKGGVL